MSDTENRQHYFVCEQDDLADGEMLKVNLPEQAPIVVYRVGGLFFATDDTCTHGEASLSEGELDDGYIIECPFHNGTFDIRTGEAVDFPCIVPLKVYPVKVEEGRVLINLELGKTLNDA